MVHLYIKIIGEVTNGKIFFLEKMSTNSKWKRIEVDPHLLVRCDMVGGRDLESQLQPT